MLDAFAEIEYRIAAVSPDWNTKKSPFLVKSNPKYEVTSLKLAT
jgi:hypothetical protein